MNNDEVLWVEKYRPQTVRETILPKKLKETFQGYVDAGFIPNLILAGSPGVGKTTAAKAMLTEMGFEFYFINGSMKGNIDTLRVDVADFASSVSFNGKRKYVLFDEADYLNPNSTQPALRGFMEEFSNNCGFILTCNFPARIIDSIHSRCGGTIDFTIPDDEKQTLAFEFFTRVQEILKAESIKYYEGNVAWVIERYFPDWRKVLNSLQNCVKNNEITQDRLKGLDDDDIREVFGFLKNKEFSKLREWSAQNGTGHPRDIFHSLYRLGDEYLTPAGHAQSAILINKYEYNAAFVANQEINLVAALLSIMTECEGEFK